MRTNEIRVRFAPSPTGFLHVGGLRTALFNYLFAKKYKGEFLLRIEDTDRERLVEGSEEDIKENLKLFGLNWDEQHKQSERLAKYREYADKLLTDGKAYYEESEKGKAIRFKLKSEGSTKFKDLVYGDLEFQNATLKDPIILKSDGYPVYNFANVIDDHETRISHVIRGEEFLPSTPIHIQIYDSLGWNVPEFIHLPLILDGTRKKLSKRTGDVAVREYIQKGYLPQALLNFIALLGWNPKTEQEVFSLIELIGGFAVEKINRAGAVFDLEKLDFINREWRKKLNLGAKDPLFQKALKSLTARFDNLTPTLSGIETSFLPSPLAREGGRMPDEGAVVRPLPPSAPSPGLGREKGKDYRGEGERERSQTDPEEILNKIWPLILERIKGPSDIEEKLPEFYFFFIDPEYEASLLVWKDTPKDKLKNNLEKLLEFVKSLNLFSSPLTKGQGRGEELQKQFENFLAEQGIGKGEALWPLRVALSGQQNSPSPFEIIEAFSKLPNGKQTVMSRIKTAIQKL